MNKTNLTRIFSSVSLWCSLLMISPLLVNAQTLKDAAQSKGKYIGTIFNINYFNGSGNETDYDTTVKREFNAVVAENNHKSGFLLKNSAQNDLLNVSIDDINTQELNKLMDYGTANNTVVRGHVLIWHNGVPPWFENIAYNWNDAQIKQFATNYITAILTYCKNYSGGKFDEWDVINEIITDGDAEYRTTYPVSNGTKDVWFKNVATVNGGEGMQSFIDHCFTVAKSVDPAPKLFYNDYSIEFFNRGERSKNAFMRNMIQGMINRNIPIDGVGLQGHFISNTTFNANRIKSTIDAIGNMKPGMICNITELDFRICSQSDTALETQAQNYYDTLEVVMNNQFSTGIVFWGFTDKHSWIPEFFGNCDNALLFDRSYAQKRAYQGVLHGILGTPIPPLEQGPYNGSPIPIASSGTSNIKFVHFDIGGQNVSYFDKTPGQEGGGNGLGDVDTTNGEIVNFVEKDEWLEYTIDVEKSGVYNVVFTTASTSDAMAQMTIDGANIIQGSTTVTFPKTTGFGDYKTSPPSQVQLNSGEHILRVYFTETPVNLDQMSFTPNTLGITNFDVADNLKLYPNPFNKRFDISFKNIENVTQFSLLDIYGNTVYIQKHDGQPRAIMQPVGLSSGMYFVKIDWNTGIQKVIRVLKK